MTTSTPYEQTYNTYTSAANQQVYQSRAIQKTNVDLFFKDTVESNYTKIQELGSKINEILEQGQAQKVVIDLIGSASSPQTDDYNKKLSSRRISSVENFFNTFTFANKKTLSKWISEGKVVFTRKPQGEQSTATPRAGSTVLGPFSCTQNLTGNDKIYSVQAMACRAVIINKITIEPNVNQPVLNNVGVNAQLLEDGKKIQPIKPGAGNTQAIQQPTQYLYKGASKKLLRYLLSECDYFEVMKVSNPFIYDSIKEKIKYFQPSFHSMTPEGLNSRLTFLQQCTRPGDTIPTIGADGQKLYNDAINTSFGAPPVLVLRIGDFYNTKIIPKSFNFTYDKTFDMNPEGIGFQPMIVDVQMSFNFVGGMGLKTPIDTLQNALSFNYYANTEMYDERAEATEDTTKLDKEIIQSIQNQNPVVGAKNVQNNLTTDGGNTIGVQTVTGQTASGVTGTIAYKNFMNGLVDQTKEYFNGGLTYFENFLNNYNYGIMSLVNDTSGKNVGYNTGTLNGNTTAIIGKSLQVQKNLDNSFSKLIAAIDGGDIPIFADQAFVNPLITTAQKRLFKKNYKDFVNTYKNNFVAGISENISTIVQTQQNLVFNFDRLNFVLAGPAPTNGYDGKVNKQNIAEMFITTGTTETFNGSPVNTYTQLGTDATTLSNNIGDYITQLTNGEIYIGTAYNKTTGAYTPPSSENLTNTLLNTDFAKLEYMMMSKAMLKDNKQTFLNALKQGLDQATQNAVDFYYDGIGNSSSRFNVWKQIYDQNKTLITTFKTSTVGLSFVEYTPTFGKTQERVTTFETTLTPPNNIKNNLQNLYLAKNDSSQINPYNLKRKFN